MLDSFLGGRRIADEDLTIDIGIGNIISEEL
jgi:hypothetical protein